jgi:hypothetical protein
VEKLGVEAIGVEEGRREVPHGEQKAAAGGDRRHTSGSRCGALGNQLRGCRASQGREESSRGVIMVRGWLRRPVHSEQEAAAELVVAGAMEDKARAQEGEIEWVGEHQWATAVL